MGIISIPCEFIDVIFKNINLLISTYTDVEKTLHVKLVKIFS